MKIRYPLSAACLFGMLLIHSCSSDAGDATEKTTGFLQKTQTEMSEATADRREQWREERAEAVKELTDLRATLENHRIREQKRMDRGIKYEKKRAESKALVAELGANIARIDKALEKLASSTAADWSTVQAEARQTGDETKSWWGRQMELIDQKTDADNDNDGH